MPWFPDFVSAVELARRQTQAAGQSDPVAQYLRALQRGDIHDLETAWPGKVVVHDPRAGDVRGHKHLRQFVRASQSLWAQHDATIEKVASTCVGRRAVVELSAQVTDFEGHEVVWPLAVVAESPGRPVRGVSHVLQPVAGGRAASSPVPPTREGGWSAW